MKRVQGTSAARASRAAFSACECLLTFSRAAYSSWVADRGCAWVPRGEELASPGGLPYGDAVAHSRSCAVPCWLVGG